MELWQSLFVIYLVLSRSHNYRLGCGGSLRLSTVGNVIITVNFKWVWPWCHRPNCICAAHPNKFQLLQRICRSGRMVSFLWSHLVLAGHLFDSCIRHVYCGDRYREHSRYIGCINHASTSHGHKLFCYEFGGCRPTCWHLRYAAGCGSAPHW